MTYLWHHVTSCDVMTWQQAQIESRKEKKHSQDLITPTLYVTWMRKPCHIPRCHSRSEGQIVLRRECKHVSKTCIRFYNITASNCYLELLINLYSYSRQNCLIIERASWTFSKSDMLGSERWSGWWTWLIWLIMKMRSCYLNKRNIKSEIIFSYFW